MEQTISLKRMLVASWKIASDSGHKEVTLYHLFLHWASDLAGVQGSLPATVIKYFGIDELLIVQCINVVTGREHRSGMEKSKPTRSDGLRLALTSAQRFAHILEDKAVGQEHVFLAALDNAGVRDLPAIKRVGWKKLREKTLELLGVPTDEQTKDMMRVRSYMENPGRMEKHISIGVYGTEDRERQHLDTSLRLRVCLLVATELCGRRVRKWRLNEEKFSWLMEKTKDLV